MKEIFGVPDIIVEARESALAKTKEGRKPGLNWALLTLIAFLILMIGDIIDSMLVSIPAFVPMIFKGPDAFNRAYLQSELATVLTLVFLGVITVMFALYVKFVEKRKIRTIGFVKKNAVVHYLIGIVVGFGIFSLAILICYLTGAITIEKSSNFSMLYFILYNIGWFIQGMEEEVVCRGFLLTSISRRNSVVAGTIINALFFACLHLANDGLSVLAFINLILFGLFASLVFVKTGNIWMCSAIHSVWNMVQGNFYGIQVSGNPLMPSVLKTNFVEGKDLFNGGAFGLEGGLGVTIVLVIGIVIFFFIPTGKKAAEEKKS
ncbi:MAG: CPBP family intramembrane metalloprotease [Clostridiales bacterium]|nr:CPBP family intramembrane metalloprotease [Clostridiales bacterium]